MTQTTIKYITTTQHSTRGKTSINNTEINLSRATRKLHVQKIIYNTVSHQEQE
jgi:hypothetical protein